jgi:hypothetical protein
MPNWVPSEEQMIWPKLAVEQLMVLFSAELGDAVAEAVGVVIGTAMMEVVSVVAIWEAGSAGTLVVLVAAGPVVLVATGADVLVDAGAPVFVGAVSVELDATGTAGPLAASQFPVNCFVVSKGPLFFSTDKPGFGKRTQTLSDTLCASEKDQLLMSSLLIPQQE